MTKSKPLLLSALILCASLLPSLAADSPAVLGILEIRGLENLSGATFELTKATGQPMAREMVSMLLHGALGTMPGMGLQPNGKVRALWLEGDTEQGSLALLLPVENDGADYLASLGQSGWRNESETADGLQHFVAPKGSGMAWKDVYFLPRGATLLAAPGAAEVRKADAALATLPSILPAEGTVVVQLRPAALIEALGPKIKEQMDAAFDAKSGAPKESAAIGKLYASGYLALASQLEECTLGLGVADGHLNLHSRVAPVAGGTLAKWLATVRPPSPAASVVNLPGALFVETLHMGDLGLLAPAYFRYVEALMKLMPQEPETDLMATYVESLKTYWNQMDGDFGIALMPPAKASPVRLAEFVALKDSSGLRALIPQMVKSENDLMAALFAAQGPMPVTFELVLDEPREHREIPVDRLTYRLTLGDPLRAMWPEFLPTELAIEMAWLPGGVLASVGDASLTDTLVDRALDGVASPVSDLASWKAFYPSPEPALVDLSHVALFDAARAYLTLYADPAAARSIPAGSGNLDGASYMAMGGAMSRARFSLADIGAIAQKAQEAREKAMAARMQRRQAVDRMDDFDFAPENDSQYESWNEDDDEGSGEDETEPTEAE